MPILNFDKQENASFWHGNKVKYVSLYGHSLDTKNLNNMKVQKLFLLPAYEDNWK